MPVQLLGRKRGLRAWLSLRERAWQVAGPSEVDVDITTRAGLVETSVAVPTCASIGSSGRWD
jgi:hypothetical protein